MNIDFQDEKNKKLFIIGYGHDITRFTEVALYEDIILAMKSLKKMKTTLPDFQILDYRIEIFLKRQNKTIHSGETIRI